tara:strand:- start:969 stop:1433 length:465 start_codon:yes stop_codon:yes gene_type:complete
MFFEENRIRVFKTRPSARVPDRAHSTDAGMDFFFCPESAELLKLDPGEGALLETGIKMEVPAGCMLQIMNKSGVASKKQLVTGACVVDEGYDGEIFVNLQNIGKETQYITPGQKIAQGVFVRIEKPTLNLIEIDSIYGKETSRGAGALGSTGER